MQQKQMNTVVLLLGGNLGDTKLYFQQAIEFISERIGSTHVKSGLYESKAWGFDSEDLFLNQVITCKTNLNPISVLEKCLDIEKYLGRKRHKSLGYESRLIDIDILFYNNEEIHSERLDIPHPRLHERNFTLCPLCEIMPEFIHPVLQKRIDILLKECLDKLEVRRVE